MTTALEQRTQRQAAVVQRLVASRTRLRSRLIVSKPAPGLKGRLAGLSQQVAALVQRHPGFSAGGALLLGALLVRARPWRWALSTGVWALLVPRVLPTLAATLTAARLGVWADVITTWLKGDDAQPAATAAPSAPATPGTPAVPSPPPPSPPQP